MLVRVKMYFFTHFLPDKPYILVYYIDKTFCVMYLDKFIMFLNVKHYDQRHIVTFKQKPNIRTFRQNLLSKWRPS